MTRRHAFDVEAVLVLSEVDPALNAAPGGFDMRNYSPKYRLINGKAYPATAHIAVPAGQKLALRTVNAGLSEHSLGVLGLRQALVATGSHALTYPSDVFAETAQPGQTLDSIVTIPATSSTSSPSYLLYETAAGDGVSAVQSFAGMATTIDVSATTVPLGAPVVSNVVIAPTSVPAGTPVGVTADATATTPQNVARLEWQLDSVGSWTAVPVTAALTVTGVPFTVATTGLTAGTHTVSVRAVDDTAPTALVGTAVNATFTVTGSGAPADTTGPLVTGLTALPSVSDGKQTIQIAATGDDRTTGNSNITGASVTVTPAPAVPVTAALPNRTDNPVAAITASIPATTLNALAPGTYTVTLTATDAVGNITGTPATTTFLVDGAGPVVSNVAVNPAANNGTLESRTGAGVFTVSAKLVDAVSIGYGEAFFDTAGTPGTGFPLIVNSAIDPNVPANAQGGITVSGDVPLSQLTGLINGGHTVVVRGRDGAGNWSSVTDSGTLFIDRIVPTVTATATPNRGGATTTVTATVVDTAPSAGFGAPVGRVEAWIDTAAAPNVPAIGAGTALTQVGITTTWSGALPVNIASPGTYRMNVRVRDAAGNVSLLSQTNFSVTPNAIFSNTFTTTTSPYGWQSLTGAFTRTTATGVAITAGSGTVPFTGGTAGYVTNTSPAAEATYHATFDVRPTSTGATTVGPVTIFRAASGTSATAGEVFRVEYRRVAGAGQLVLVVTRTGGTTSTAAVALPSGVTNVQVDWSRVTGSATLTVGTGVSAVTSTVTGLTITPTIETVFLGRLGATGGLNGAMVFDNFVSARDHLPL